MNRVVIVINFPVLLWRELVVLSGVFFNWVSIPWGELECFVVVVVATTL